ncbi:ABC transporter [Lysinibacillus sp. 2017]|uniref:methionine ABC transporter ATP-binding protein n=1 Tax=unclassified Lysinibacillus TaxID=2636778 RepID=UPI000D528319|nr:MULTISPECIES: ATP-binding cassette domain-containing protein [unclassified Lysinibacillus]AWE07377.1 ABC transporter [Lysinibacillus sp. 2017]TGN36539.1 ATP-binding cassette domain-containing protein [Lysinibacillus sp. S2017]
MIQLHNVSKKYEEFYAVKNVSLTINQGEIYGLIGPSGAGKSTLLRLMNLLEFPDAGEVNVAGQQLTYLSSNQLRNARKSIGMIFQHFNLVANKTVYENVAISLKLANYPKREIKTRVEECLKFVGLESMQKRYPSQLSGGQKQRVAIARALANKPQMLLCDEPTSSLDPTTTAEILTVLQTINKTFGVTIVIVSHEMDVIKSICQRVCVLADGKVYETVDIIPAGITKIAHDPQTFVEQLTRKDDVK